MNERRFDLLLTLALLGFGVWYGVRMYSYPANAGMVPAIVATVFVGALVVQAVLMGRRLTARAEADGGVAEEAVATAEVSGSGRPGTEELPPRASNEPEPDTYETLIALKGVRRRRFLTIVAFTIAFYVGTMLVSFVLTAGVLITAILLVSREKLYVALTGGLVGALSAYGLVVGLLDLPPFEGYLIG